MSIYSPDDPINSLKGVGPSIESKLNRLGIFTIRDLLKHFPRSYLDFSKPVKISALRNKVAASFLAEIDKPKSFYSSSGKLITQAQAHDSSGKILLTWFNNPYIKRLIEDGQTYSIAGKPSFFGHGLTVISPVIEKGNSFSINTQGFVPVYPQTEGLTSRWLRKKIFEILPLINLKDPLNSKILKQSELLTLKEAVSGIHFPSKMSQRWQSDKRLSYNEHLRINISNRLELEKLGHSIPIKTSTKIDRLTAQKLPFVLTAGQQKILSAIESDLQSREYTHRLIQGETGSGKTAPLIFAANQTTFSGYSCAILAPTEILAHQHFSTFKQFCLDPESVKLITAGNKIDLSSHPTVFIGTHALLNQLTPDLNPALAFVAIDEQHKFGVNQRDLLMKRTPLPHIFNLSATPIPRTVALGLLGDIEISNIYHKPANRLPVKTFVVTPTKFKDSPKWLISELAKGNHLFVVCPNISEHDNQVSSVEKETKAYRKMIPTQYPVYSLHGKLKPEDQQAIIHQYKNHPGSVLVATSLIEVGLDIPSANIMIIHSAERFGLAQLHQLRGRVGRGEAQGYCFLVPSVDDEAETERLQLLQKYHSGLVLAQKDLRLRGAGQIYGEKQHGILPTRLKYFWSKKLFTQSKAQAKSLIQQSPSRALAIARNLLCW